MGRQVAALVVAITILLAPTSARSDHEDLPSVSWTSLRPPMPGVPSVENPAVPCGVDASPACVDGVIQRLVAHWEPLDQSCDPRVIFELINVRATQLFRTYFSDMRGENFFEDEPKAVNLDRVLQDLYFDAVAAYETGDAPPAWTVAWDAALAHRTTAPQDAFLGINAHLQRDLPVALAAVGITSPDGTSYKPDHDRLNEIIATAIDVVEDEIAERYDPMMSMADLSPLPWDEVFTIEVVRLWRENAFRNAERLTVAPNEAERDLVMASIEAEAEAWARMIATQDWSWWWSVREAHCLARVERESGGGES